MNRRGQGQPLDPHSRGDFEARFGSDFSGVRVHTDRTAHHAAQEIGARAFTTGRDIYFAQGQYHPLTPTGRWLLAHELTHVVQQREGAIQPAARAPSISPSDSHWEREADNAANAIAANRPVTSHFTPAPTGPPQRDLVDDALNLIPPPPTLEDVKNAGKAIVNEAGELVNEAGELIEEAADTIQGFAVEVWNFAQNIANAVSGAVSISGTALTITGGKISTDSSITADLPLPAWEVFVPFAGAAFTTGIVTVHGELGLQLTAQPMASVQLGPGSINGITITIDPVSGVYSGAGSYTIATALQLGGELRAGLRGQVGLIIAWPDPPLLIPIELAGIEAGLAARIIGTAVGNTTVAAAFGYAAGTFSGSYNAASDLGFALDMGLAGYGQLDVLGITLCRLYWPIVQASYETTTHLDVAASASISTAGPSLSFSASAATSPGPAFSDLPLRLSRELFADECPVLEILCTVLHALGMMPSDQGAAWTGVPGGPHPGPLPDVYPRSPAGFGRDVCPGACGFGCHFCGEPGERFGCETTADGGHRIWKYPNYTRCPTHAACRQYWACRSQFGMLSPPWCALECMCDYRPATCAAWAAGQGPSDGLMDYSDPPVVVGECFGRCPDEVRGKDNKVAKFRYCLDPITLFEGVPVAPREPWKAETGYNELYSKTFLIPKTPIPVQLQVGYQGGVEFGYNAHMGKVVLQDVCLEMNPATGHYQGGGKIVVDAELNVFTKLVASLLATARVPCLINIVDAEAGLEASGWAKAAAKVTGEAKVSCQNGALQLDAAAYADACASIGAELKAFVKARIFGGGRLLPWWDGWEVYNKSWPLARADWEHCWHWDIGSTSGRIPVGSAARGLGSAAQSGAGAMAMVQPSIAPKFISAQETIKGLLDAGKTIEKIAKFGSAVPSLADWVINKACPYKPNKNKKCPKAVASNPAHKTHVEHSGSDRGGSVSAEPLTFIAGNTTGSPAQQILPGWDCVPANERTGGSWLHGHLLHGATSKSGSRHLHGPGGDKWNLILIQNALNQRMRGGIEGDAVRRVHDDKEILYYHVSVGEYWGKSGQLADFGRRLSISYGCYDPDTKERTPLGGESYDAEDKPAPPAGCTGGSAALPPGSGGNPPVQPKLLPGQEEKGTRVFQAKYVVNSANDHFEREADRAADSVVSGRAAPKLTPLTSGGLGSGLQRAGSRRDAPERVSASGGARAPPRRDPVASVLESPGSGSPLPATTRAPIEESFGEDLSHVRVHTGPPAEAAAASIGARAFTSGHNIWMGRGQSPHDRHLMAHETAHVVQQAGPRGTPAPSTHPPNGPAAATHPPIAPRRRTAGTHPRSHAPPVQRACCGGDVQRSADSDVQRTTASEDNVQRTAEPEVQRTADEAPVQRGLGDTLAEGFWSLVRRLAPNLEPILREISEQGIVGFLRNRIRAGMSSIFSALHNQGGGIAVLGDTFQRLIGVAGELMGQLAAGNCEPVFAAVRQLGSALEEMCGSAWNAITDFFQPVGDFFSDLWQSFGAPVLQWLQETGSAAWEYISGLGATLWGYIQPIKDSIASTLGDAWGWVKRQLGLGESEGENEGGLMQWVQQKAQDAWESLTEFFQPVIAPIQAAVARVREILPLDAIFSLRERVTAWLQRTAQSVSAMEPEGGVVEQQTSLRDDILPGVLATIDSVGERLTAAGSWVAEKVGTISVSAIAMLDALEGNTLLGVAARALGWLRERIGALVPLVQDRVLGLFATATRALAAVRQWIRPIFDTLVELATTMQDIAGRVGNFVLGALFGWIPACIREPIKNFILTQILARIPIFAQLAEIPNIWARVQSIALRILRQIFVNGDLIGAAWTFFRTLLEVIGLPPRLIVNIVAKAATALADILSNPVRFLLTLLGAVAEGFRRFFSNILTHLVSGLAGWLFGACADAGLDPPRDLSLRSILGFVLQVFDLTVDRIFARIARRVGDVVAQRLRQALQFATGAWEFVATLVREGPPGLWRYVRERLNNLWEIVLNAAIQWIMSALITTGSRWLLSLLDASGITPVINSIIALYRAIESAVQYMVQILQIVERVLDAVGEIARGVVDTAAGFLENTLARALPVAIGFLANQLGLGNVGRRVREVVEAIRERVDQALDWVIDRAIRMGQSVLNALRSGASAVGGAVRRGVTAVAGWLGLRKEFTSGGHRHQLYFRGSGSSAEMIVESDPTNLEDFLTQAQALPANAGKRPLITEIRRNRTRIRTLQALASLTPAQETEMENAVNRISTNLAQLTFPDAALGGAPAGPLPRTQVTWTGSSVGAQVVARPLTRNPGNTVGSIAQDVLPAWSCMPAAESRDYWVRAHLLHGRTSSSGDRNLHGPGNQGWNLIISDKRLNGAMSRRAEQPALARVYNNNEILYYRASVRPAASSGQRRSFAESITVTWGNYDPATGADGSPLFSETFDNDRDIPTTCT